MKKYSWNPLSTYIFCYSHVVVDVQAVMDRLSLASLACGVFNPAPAVVELTTETAPANISCFRLLKCALFGMVKCSPALRVSVVVNSFVIERVGFVEAQSCDMLLGRLLGSFCDCIALQPATLGYVDADAFTDLLPGKCCEARAMCAFAH